MSSRYVFVGAILLVSVTAGSALAQVNPGSGLATQTSRQISEAIAQRISQAQLARVPLEEQKRNQAWYYFGYTDFSADLDSSIKTDFDGFENLFGIDRRIGDFYLGFVFGYGYADFDVTFPLKRTSLDAHGYDFTPYAAWVINDNFFVNLLAGYGLGDFGDDELFFGVEIDKVHGGGSELGLNAVAAFDAPEGTAPAIERFEVLGRAGFRHGFVYWDDSPVNGNWSHFFTIFAGGDVGARMGIFKPYARATYEGVFDEGRSSEHAAYLGGGLTIDVTERITLDFGAWTAVGNSDLDNTQASATARLRF